MSDAREVLERMILAHENAWSNGAQRDQAMVAALRELVKANNEGRTYSQDQSFEIAELVFAITELEL